MSAKTPKLSKPEPFRISRLNVILFAIVVVLGVWLTILIAGEKKAPDIDGIACESMEGEAIHVHVQLQLYKDGHEVPLPQGIGIPGDCMYWLHTHTADGIVHIESPVVRPFTLGQFFEIWGVNPIGTKPSIFDEAGLKILVRHEGEPAFSAVGDKGDALVFAAHDLVAVGTGDFSPHSFSFPDGL